MRQADRGSPRIAVSVDASTFTGQPDDATMQAVGDEMMHLNSGSLTLTAEINNPQKSSDGRFTPICSQKPR
jgi:hypothetical protein